MIRFKNKMNIVIKKVIAQMRHPYGHMRHVMGKPTFWFTTRSDTNQAVQLHKLEISDLESRGIILSM